VGETFAKRRLKDANHSVRITASFLAARKRAAPTNQFHQPTNNQQTKNKKGSE